MTSTVLEDSFIGHVRNSATSDHHMGSYESEVDAEYNRSARYCTSISFCLNGSRSASRIKQEGPCDFSHLSAVSRHSGISELRASLLPDTA
ncbi:hypothetical protein GDO78_015677, partial [Eleutherodactylus coqui]